VNPTKTAVTKHLGDASIEVHRAMLRTRFRLVASPSQAAGAGRSALSAIDAAIKHLVEARDGLAADLAAETTAPHAGGRR
jgi:hypothetical protein